jgi:diacylglycerol kinase (ATP)
MGVDIDWKPDRSWDIQSGGPLPPGTPAVLIVNSKARRGKEWFPVAKELLQEQDIQLIDAVATKAPGELRLRVEAAVSAGVPLVIVGGGDGSFSSIAHNFAGAPSVLGVLPLGTGNAFARDLGINANVEEAVSVITKGKVQTVDLGLIEDHTFLNVATVGLTTLIARNLTTEGKRRLGRAVYLVALLRSLSSVRPFQVRVDTPEGSGEFESLQVVIGNGRFHAGPFPVAPGASITEGKLSLYALQGRNRSQFFRLAWHLRTGRHVELDDVFHLETTGGTLETTPARHVTVDGEVAFETPVRFKVAPDVLRVMAPLSFKG